MEKTFRRSQTDKILFGVCSGIGRYFNTDPLIVRVIFAVAFFLGLGSPLLIYLVLALVMPKDRPVLLPPNDLSAGEETVLKMD